MYHLKGFVNIQSFMTTNPNAVAELGELSQWSMTFSRQITDHTLDTLPGYRFLAMSSKDDTGATVTVPTPLVSEVLLLVKAICDYATAHLPPYNLSDLLVTVSAAFTGKIENLVAGPLAIASGIAMPSWVQWSSLESANSTIRIWLSDPAFSSQYDEYEIVVVPPLTELDGFFTATSNVVNLLAAEPIVSVIDRGQAAKNGYPETYTRMLDFNYVPREVRGTPMLTHWLVLIYGNFGDNTDTIKEAIISYVLANSTRPQADWLPRFPELFKHTEFTVLPRWDKFSIPDMAIQSGLYSTVSDPTELVQFVKNNIDFYPTTWIGPNLVSLPHPYKDLLLCIVNGTDNIDGKTSFPALIPDYLPIGSTSLDFNRMTEYTRNWSIFIEELLILAESANQSTIVPPSVRKISRNGKLYIMGTYDAANYYVAAKGNY